jgi:hypothetical protein
LPENIHNFSFNIVFQFLQRLWIVHMNYIFSTNNNIDSSLVI